jgi:hypothetical protein
MHVMRHASYTQPRGVCPGSCCVLHCDLPAPVPITSRRNNQLPIMRMLQVTYCWIGQSAPLWIGQDVLDMVTSSQSNQGRQGSALVCMDAISARRCG